MSSSQSIQCLTDSPIFAVRRSQRKRVKPNHKRKTLVQRPIKQQQKRLTNFNPSRKFDQETQKTKLSPYENSKRLCSISQPKKQEILGNMKQAIKEQQSKLKRLFLTKLNQEWDLGEGKILFSGQKQHLEMNQKADTSIHKKSLNSEDYQSELQVKKDLMEIGTAEQIEYICDESEEKVEDSDFMVQNESEFFISEIPAFKKESSKLLSDNYENQELLYTIDRIVPNQHTEEIDLYGQLQFSND